VGKLAKELHSPDFFGMVTEMLPIPSGALGMEALREMAVRYKLRYILLYRESIEKHREMNPWAAGYATLIGALFMPGSTLIADGFVEASLFDVKTGLLLYTVRQRVSSSQKSNLWYRESKQAQMQAKLALNVASKLAEQIRKGASRYAAAALVENKRLERSVSESVASSAPSASEPANDNARVALP
jgi:hypothetical protein